MKEPRYLWVMIVTSVLLLGPLAGQDEISPVTNQPRPWKLITPDGTKDLHARLVGIRDGQLTFEKDGDRSTVPLDQLAPEDRHAALIDRVGSGIVMISTRDVYGKPAGFGSGFLIHRSGLIVTNYHVIAGAAEVSVNFRDHDQTHEAKALSVDRQHDIAFLRIDGAPENVHVVEILSKELPTLGMTVWTLGHPNGLKDTAGWGQISAVRKTEDLPANLRGSIKSPADSRWLQTTAVLAQGSSGGPLLNEQGKAVGINTFLLSPQLGFAIHIVHGRDAFQRALKADPLDLPMPPGDDEDPMGWLSPELAQILKTYSEEYSGLAEAASNVSAKEAMNQAQALTGAYLEKLFSLAQENPGSWASLQALTVAVGFCGQTDDEETLGRICEQSLQHHLDGKHIQSVVTAVSRQSNETSRGFCRNVIKQSAHESVRMGASMGLLGNLLRWFEVPDSIDLSEIRRRRDELEMLCTQIQADFKKSEDETEKQKGQLLTKMLRKQIDRLKIGKTVAEMSGVDSKGVEFKLSDYRGKVILLDFFADWCPHCKRMYPEERAMVEQLADQPFALLGIHCESESVLQKLVDDGTVTWRSWADGQEGPLATAWEIDSFPTMALVDANGILRWKSSGAPEAERLHELIGQLIDEVQRE